MWINKRLEEFYLLSYAGIGFFVSGKTVYNATLLNNVLIIIKIYFGIYF